MRMDCVTDSCRLVGEGMTSIHRVHPTVVVVVNPTSPRIVQ
jgi:hypothetical protein